jgi:hypothetical protein
VGQDSVTVNQLLWAVQGDVNSHGNGQLHLSPDGSVTIHGIPVVTHTPTTADTDDLLVSPHDNPETAGGSGNVTAYG